MPTSRRREVLVTLAASALVPESRRLQLLTKAGVRIGAWTKIDPGLRVAGEGELSIGDVAYINADCIIDCAADVRIGNNVSLGNRVGLYTSGHDMSDPTRRAGPRVLRPIVVGDGAWLGAQSVVLGGVTIGPGSVVAAGAVVTRDVPPHTLYAGVPARFVRDLPR